MSENNTKSDSLSDLFKAAKENKSSNRGEGGSTADKRKQSLYFPETMLEEIKSEATRLDRSLSWVVQRAWKLAKAEIAQIPSITQEGDDDDA